MPGHLDKVLAHAERQLTTSGGVRPTEILPLYKKFLRIEEHRLRLKHQAGGGGRQICALRVDLVDVLLRHVFAAAATFAREQADSPVMPLTLLALGGYGRGELNPWSDVDVMFARMKEHLERLKAEGWQVVYPGPRQTDAPCALREEPPNP